MDTILKIDIFDAQDMSRKNNEMRHPVVTPIRS